MHDVRRAMMMLRMLAGVVRVYAVLAADADLDVDDDGDVDLVDFIVLQTCYSVSGGGDPWRRGGRLVVTGSGWVR